MSASSGLVGGLHQACEEGNVEAVKKQIAQAKKMKDKASAILSATDKNGWAPLHCAANCVPNFIKNGDTRHLDICRLLLEAGADARSVTRSENSTLHLFAKLQGPLTAARKKPLLQVLQLLVDRGADVNLRNNTGVTPLHEAAFRGATDIAHFLISHHADVNARTIDGETALHYAVRGNQEDMVRMLLATPGVDLEVRGARGTPLMIAEQCKFEGIRRLLEEARAASLAASGSSAGTGGGGGSGPAETTLRVAGHGQRTFTTSMRPPPALVPPGAAPQQPAQPAEPEPAPPPADPDEWQARLHAPGPEARVLSPTSAQAGFLRGLDYRPQETLFLLEAEQFAASASAPGADSAALQAEAVRVYQRYVADLGEGTEADDLPLLRLRGIPGRVAGDVEQDLAQPTPELFRPLEQELARQAHANLVLALRDQFQTLASLHGCHGCARSPPELLFRAFLSGFFQAQQDDAWQLVEEKSATLVHTRRLPPVPLHGFMLPLVAVRASTLVSAPLDRIRPHLLAVASRARRWEPGLLDSCLLDRIAPDACLLMQTVSPSPAAAATTTTATAATTSSSSQPQQHLQLVLRCHRTLGLPDGGVALVVLQRSVAHPRYLARGPVTRSEQLLSAFAVQASGSRGAGVCLVSHVRVFAAQGPPRARPGQPLPEMHAGDASAEHVMAALFGLRAALADYLDRLKTAPPLPPVPFPARALLPHFPDPLLLAASSSSSSSSSLSSSSSSASGSSPGEPPLNFVDEDALVVLRVLPGDEGQCVAAVRGGSLGVAPLELLEPQAAAAAAAVGGEEKGGGELAEEALARQLLSGPEFALAASVLDALDQATRDRMSRGLVRFFARHAPAQLLPLLQRMIQLHIARARSPTTLFRGAEGVSQCLSLYARAAGATYLATHMRPLVEAVVRGELLPRGPGGQAAEFEIDPALAPAGQLEANTRNLCEATRLFLAAMLGSIQDLPRSFHVIARTLHDALQERGFAQYRHSVVGGFLFLRFLCPSLVASSGPAAADKTAQRTLILISKVLQNLANGVEFKKEAHMEPLNRFLGEYRLAINNYLDAVSRVPQQKREDPSPSELLQPQPGDDEFPRQLAHELLPRLVQLRHELDHSLPPSPAAAAFDSVLDCLLRIGPASSSSSSSSFSSSSSSSGPSAVLLTGSLPSSQGASDAEQRRLQRQLEERRAALLQYVQQHLTPGTDLHRLEELVRDLELAAAQAALHHRSRNA